MLTTLAADAVAAVEALADSEVVVAGTTTVRAIWRSPTERTLDMLEAAVPSVTVATTGLPTVARGTTVLRSGTTYRVIGIEPDGYGLVTLLLEIAD